MGQWEAGTQVYRSRKEARSGMTKRSPMGRLTLWDNGKLGLGQRSRMTERSPMGRLTLWDNGKLGLRCIDRGKKHDLGRPRGVQWEGLRCGTTGSWDSGRDLG